MITFDQKIVEYLNNWTIGDAKWPIGNLILCIIALVLSVILVGIVGGALGSWIFSILGLSVSPTWWGQLLVGTVGAVVLLWIVSLIKK